MRRQTVMLKRLFAGLIAGAMIVSAMPANVSAAEAADAGQAETVLENVQEAEQDAAEPVAEENVQEDTAAQETGEDAAAAEVEEAVDEAGPVEETAEAVPEEETEPEAELLGNSGFPVLISWYSNASVEITAPEYCKGAYSVGTTLNVAEGDQLTFKVTPEKCWGVTGVKYGVDESSATADLAPNEDGTYTVTVNSDLFIDVTVERFAWWVSFNTDPNYDAIGCVPNPDDAGTVYVPQSPWTGGVPVYKDQDFSFYFNVNEGYGITKVTYLVGGVESDPLAPVGEESSHVGDEGKYTQTGIYTIPEVTADTEIRVYNEKLTYQVSFMTSPNTGSIGCVPAGDNYIPQDPFEGAVPVYKNRSFSFYFNVNEGYRITKVTYKAGEEAESEALVPVGDPVSYVKDDKKYVQTGTYTIPAVTDDTVIKVDSEGSSWVTFITAPNQDKIGCTPYGDNYIPQNPWNGKVRAYKGHPFQFLLNPDPGYKITKVTCQMGEGEESGPLIPEQKTYEKNGKTYTVDIYSTPDIAHKTTIYVYSVGPYFMLDDATTLGSVFATKQAKQTGEDRWSFNNMSAEDFTFTVTTKVDVEPFVSIGDVFQNTPEPSFDAGYTKATYTYTVKTADLQGQVLKIEDAEADNELKVKMEQGVSKITVQVDGKYYAGEERYNDHGYLYFDVPARKQATITVTAKPYYRVAGFTATDSEDNTYELGANNGVATLRVDDAYSVEPQMEAVPRMAIFDKIGGDRDLADKETRKVRYDLSEEIVIKSGESYLPIESVSAKMGSTPIAGFAEVKAVGGEEPNYRVKIDVGKAAGKGSKPVTVTIVGDFGTRTLYYDIVQKPTSVTLKGFNSNNEVTQVAGMVADYAVTLNSGADYTNIEVADVSDNGLVDFDQSSGKLSVATYDSNGVIADDDITFKIKELGGEELGTFTVKPAEPKKFAAPTATLKSASDIDMTLSLKLPKALEKYSQLYYHVEATAVDDTHEDVMVHSYDEFIEPADAYKIPLMQDDSPDYGDGFAKKYDLKVTIVQVKDPTKPDKFQEDNLSVGNSKELKKQSTKDFCYEAKISLTKKNTSFTLGEQGVLLAVAKFSKSTSWAEVGEAYLVPNNGTMNKLDCIADEDGNIYPDNYDPDDFAPGNYTLYVSPFVPDGAHSKYATMAVTVKAPVTHITLSAPQSKIYKAAGKAATVNVKATCKYINDTYGEAKPASTKLNWEVQPEVATSSITDYISVKDGKVTVQKGYVLSGVPDENKFKVLAKAADLGDDGAESEPLEFEVTADAVELKSITIGGIKGVDKNPVAHLSTEYYEKAIRVNGEAIDDENMTVSITPNTGLELSYGGYIYASKAGTYTVKVMMNDGSKKSISKKFAVGYDEITGYEYQVLSAAGTGRAWKQDSLGFDEFGTVVTTEPQFLIVEVNPVPKHANALCDNKAVIDFDKKSAKKVTMAGSTGAGRLTLVPTKGEVKITLSSKDNKLEKKELTIKIDPIEGKLTPQKSYDLYSLDAAKREFTFGLKGIAQDTDTDGWKLAFAPLDAAYASDKNIDAALAFCDAMNAKGNALNTMFAGDKSSVTFVSTGTDPYGTQIPKGKYTCKVVLLDGDNNRVTSFAQATFNVKAAPKPKATLKPNVTMKSTDASVTLEFKTQKDLGGFDRVETMSPLVNGQEQEYPFDDYFEAAPSDDGTKIILKRRIKDSELVPLPVGVTQFSGTIGYIAYGSDHATSIVNFDPVTVTITE